MSQQQEQTTDNVVMSIDQYQTIPVPQLSKEEAKNARLAGIKDEIESKLQYYITEASAIRQKSTGAKTECKRQFYAKKFKKINVAVRESIMALQQIEYLITKAAKEDATPTA